MSIITEHAPQLQAYYSRIGNTIVVIKILRKLGCKATKTREEVNIE